MLNIMIINSRSVNHAHSALRTRWSFEAPNSAAVARVRFEMFLSPHITKVL